MGTAHAQRLENWFGKQWVESLSVAMKDFRHPVPIMGPVDGRIVVYDGDFHGRINGGRAASLKDYLCNQHGTGLSSLQDLRDKAARREEHMFLKDLAVAAPAIGATQSLFGVGTWPPAASPSSSPPGGSVHTNLTSGALPIRDDKTAETAHLKEMWVWQQRPGDSAIDFSAIMLYDSLFGVSINHATTSNSVTGVPTRYQTAALAPGNFLSGRVTTVLGATAHNITVTYVDQDGNTAEAGTAQAIRVSSAVNTCPFTQPKWWYYLNTVDNGLRNITNIALSAASTGIVDWFIGHPIGICPVGTAGADSGTFGIVDGVNSRFLMDRVFNGAALATMYMYALTTGAPDPAGKIIIARG